MVNLTRTVSLLELIWTAQSLAGLGVTIWAALDGWADYRSSQRAHHRGTLSLADLRLDWKVAAIGVAAALGGFVGHAMFLELGVFGMLSPPPPSDRTLSAAIFGWTFVGMQSTMLAAQVAVQVLRHQLRR